MNTTIPQISWGACSDCGSSLDLRNEQYGQFLGCSAYPDCDYTESVDVDLQSLLNGDVNADADTTADADAATEVAR